MSTARHKKAWSGAVKPRKAPHENQRDRQRENDAGVDAELGHRADQRCLLTGKGRLRTNGAEVRGGRDDPITGNGWS
jgi:hypothetical protein